MAPRISPRGSDHDWLARTLARARAGLRCHPPVRGQRHSEKLDNNRAGERTEILQQRAPAPTLHASEVGRAGKTP